MRELLKKDFGLCRHVLMGGMIALIVPYLAVIVYMACTSGLSDSESIEFLSLSLLSASNTSVWLSTFSIAFLGGFIIAGERRDRSAEFLAFLPPKRSAILLSKAIVCLAWVIVVAIAYFLVTDLIVPWISDGEHVYEASARMIFLACSVVAAVFGTSWLASTMLTSPVLAVLTGLVAPYGVVMIVYVLQFQFGWELADDLAITVSGTVLFAVGAVSFLGGWWYFCKRIEP